MTECEKQIEVDNLIAELKQARMAYPMGGSLDRMLADCRKLVAVARKPKISLKATAPR